MDGEGALMVYGADGDEDESWAEAVLILGQRVVY